MKRAEKATEERHRGEGKRGEMADGAFVESGENGGREDRVEQAKVVRL